MPEIFIPATYKGYNPEQVQTSPSLELQLVKLAREDAGQRRSLMVLHPILNKAAVMKCVDMANRNYGTHTDPDGHGPNWLVRELGYRLPEWYGDADNSNNIESLLTGGFGKAKDTWESWLASERHRIHVLGLNDFYAGQTNFGVGYAYVPESKMDHFWCFLSAHPEDT